MRHRVTRNSELIWYDINQLDRLLQWRLHQHRITLQATRVGTLLDIVWMFNTEKFNCLALNNATVIVREFNGRLDFSRPPACSVSLVKTSNQSGLDAAVWHLMLSFLWHIEWLATRTRIVRWIYRWRPSLIVFQRQSTIDLSRTFESETDSGFSTNRAHHLY